MPSVSVIGQQVVEVGGAWNRVAGLDRVQPTTVRFSSNRRTSNSAGSKWRCCAGLDKYWSLFPSERSSEGVNIQQTPMWFVPPADNARSSAYLR